MDCTVLGISMERSKELYNIMFKDLEAQKRPITDTEGLKYIYTAPWTLEEKLTVLARIKA